MSLFHFRLYLLGVCLLVISVFIYVRASLCCALHRYVEALYNTCSQNVENYSQTWIRTHSLKKQKILCLKNENVMLEF